MDGELLDIQPSELKFKFEPKKQISCSVRLINNSDHHVAFKVKTRDVKTYCVRPNRGVIGPKSDCDIEVKRQAEKVAPSPEVISKEKLMIQSTIVPKGTTSEQINSYMHTKDGEEKHVEEKKVNVVLVQKTEEKEMRAKMEELEVRLKKAELDIEKLQKENKLAYQEQISLDQQLKELKNKKTQVKFKCFNLKLYPSKAF